MRGHAVPYSAYLYSNQHAHEPGHAGIVEGASQSPVARLPGTVQGLYLHRAVPLGNGRSGGRCADGSPGCMGVYAGRTGRPGGWMCGAGCAAGRAPCRSGRWPGLRHRKQLGRGKTVLWKRSGPVKGSLATVSGHQTLAESRWVSRTAAGRGLDVAVTTISRVRDFGSGSADRIGEIGEKPRSWHTARYSFTVV